MSIQKEYLIRSTVVFRTVRPVPPLPLPPTTNIPLKRLNDNPELILYIYLNRILPVGARRREKE